jgi:hypothetical protein
MSTATALRELAAALLEERATPTTAARCLYAHAEEVDRLEARVAAWTRHGTATVAHLRALVDAANPLADLASEHPIRRYTPEGTHANNGNGR